MTIKQLLYSLRVDPVVLLMGPDESDTDDPVREIDPYDEPILVPTDIEHHAPISKDTGRAKLTLQLSG
jgi:hypothetical protein